jgi:Phage minor capsid protein 2
MTNVQALIDIYKKAEKEIISLLENKDFVDRLERNKTLAQIQNVLTGLYVPTQDFIIKHSSAEWQTGIAEVRDALGKVDYKASFQLIDPKASQFVMQSLVDIQDSATAEIRQVLSNSYTNINIQINRVSRLVQAEHASQVAKDLAEKIAIKQALGDPRKKITSEVINILKQKGLTGVTWQNDKGQNRNMSLDAYVERLVRNVMTNSHASSVVSQALSMGQDLVKVSTHSKPSPMCEPLQGKILSITGLTPGYQVLSEVLFQGKYSPPALFHPFCRHALSVYIPTNIKFK